MLTLFSWWRTDGEGEVRRTGEADEERTVERLKNEETEGKMQNITKEVEEG